MRLIVTLLILCFCVVRSLLAQEPAESLADSSYEQIISDVLAGSSPYPESVNELLLNIVGALEDDQDLTVEFVAGESGGFMCGNYIATKFAHNKRVIEIYRGGIDDLQQSFAGNAHRTKLHLVWGLCYEQVLWEEWGDKPETLEGFLKGTLAEEDWVEVDARVSVRLSAEVTRPLLDAGYELMSGLVASTNILESSCGQTQDKLKCENLRVMIRNGFRALKKRCQ